jgi:hypothetical protein
MMRSGSREATHDLSVEEYDRLFHGLERFDQRSSGVTFDSKLLDKAHVHADSEFHAALEAQAQQRVSRLGGQTSYRRERTHAAPAPSR